MSAFRAAFKAVRSRPKTSLFAAAVLYKAADVAASRWRRAVARERYTDDAQVGSLSLSLSLSLAPSFYRRLFCIAFLFLSIDLVLSFSPSLLFSLSLSLSRTL